MDVETSGAFFVQDGFLYTSARDNTLAVYVEMHNRNSFDADEIYMTFILDGKEYDASFPDLDRSEEEGRVYRISLPKGLETGKYPLQVFVQSDDISYETAFNLDVVSAGDFITEEEGSFLGDVSVSSFWDSVEEFFSSLF